MRQIDNYTDKEREVLALKGMTAPRTASERNTSQYAMTDAHGKPLSGIYTSEEIEAIGREKAPNKAKHSPLPWRVDFNKYDQQYRVYSVNAPVTNSMFHADNDTDAKLIVRAVNHADKLAGALRNALNMIDPFVWDKGKEAAILDAYEAAQ